MVVTPLEVVLFPVALVVSGYFSALEIALISADRLKLRQEGKEGSLNARLAVELLSDRERVLVTTLVGINLANLTAAALATSMLQALFPGWADWHVSVLTTGVVTLLILIGSEILPKVYGKQHADRFLAVSARPVMALEQLFLPVTAAVRGYVTLLLRALRRGRQAPVVTREELKVLVHEFQEETGHGRKERKMLGSILDFRQTTAREVMVPMPDVVSIERDASTDLLRALVKRHGFTRLPIYERRVDRVIGLINVFDVLFDPDPEETLERYLRPAILVPETKRIDRLMAELQRERQTMAVVVSEFGSCVGIVTMEDIVEEIVGELAEEHEVGVRKIRQIADRTYVVDALTDIDDINEELGLDLPKGRYDTLGGLVLKRFGRIPREYELFEIQGVHVEVVDTHRYGVRSVKLVLPKGDGDAAERS